MSHYGRYTALLSWLHNFELMGKGYINNWLCAIWSERWATQFPVSQTDTADISPHLAHRKLGCPPFCQDGCCARSQLCLSCDDGKA